MEGAVASSVAGGAVASSDAGGAVSASAAGGAVASSETDLSFDELSLLNNGFNTNSTANHATAKAPTTTVVVCFLPEEIGRAHV